MLKVEGHEVKNLLYSAIRSKKHLTERRKAYFRRAISIFYLFFLTKSGQNRSDIPILNFLGPSYLDFDEEDTKKDLKVTNVNEQKTLLISELLLIFSFFLNIRFLQKILLAWAQNIVFKFIKRNNVKVLIAGHPDLLISFLGFCMKKLDKKIVTVQHGIYNLSSYNVLWWEKEVASTIILYGESFAKLYESQGVDPTKILIGNPYFGSSFNSYEKLETEIRFNKKRVIFLGQQLYKISDSVFKGYNNFLSMLIDFYQTKGVQVYYKPHPREDCSQSLSPKNLKYLKFYKEKGKSDELFLDFDIYYSVNSSILIEIYLKKKICFQVDVPINDFTYDRFYEYTGIPLVSKDSLESHLNINEYLFFYASNYLNIAKEPKKSMVNLITRLIKDENNNSG